LHSFADVQYAIRVNSEKIYDCDPDDDVLVMPLFWGLPPLDYSGYNNHGTNHGATYKDGSLDFDGGDDYVDTSYKHSGAGSISFWIKSDSLAGDKLFAGHNDGNNRRFYIGIAGTDTFYGFGDTYEKTGVGNPQPHGMAVGNWYYLTLTGDGSTARYYIDNVEIATLSYSWNAGASANNFYIGAALSGVMTYANGTIDEVRISKATRSADQIALFNDNKYGLYQKVGRPIWSIPAVGVTIPIFMQNMRGSFNSPGTRGGFIN
jgi:hypothetical protein